MTKSDNQNSKNFTDEVVKNISDVVAVQSKYGFATELADYVIEYIRKVNDKSVWKPQWNECRVSYDQNKDHFVATSGYSFLPIRRVIPDADVFKAVENLQNDLDHEVQKTELQDKYADAVNYFHNDAKIDQKGIFVKNGVMSKKYFSMAELDDMKEKYSKRKRSKN